MDIYKKLREKLDKSWPIPTPAVKSEVEIDILKKIFTPEEVEIALNLSPQPEPAEVIAERAGKSVEEVRSLLESMVKKGGIFKVFTDQPMYCIFPMMPGIYEFQVGKLTPEMANLFERYYAEGLGEAVFSNETPLARVIPVEKAISADITILTYEEVNELLDGAQAITLADCICRTKKKMIGEGCDAPHKDICILLNSWAEYFANNGLGRKVTKEEAKQALKKAEEAGLVHTTLNAKDAKDNLFICNCCGCCCVILRGINQLKLPTAVAKSNFIAKVNEEECTGCDECKKKCHVNAITIEDSVAKINYERCIGCGVCVTFCPQNAISMERKQTQVEPPDNITELMTKIMEGRSQ